MSYLTKNSLKQNNLATKFTLSAVAILMSFSLYAAPSTDAGLLSKEVQQSQPQQKLKPTGELFNNQVKIQSSTQNSANTFHLKNVRVVELNGETVNEDLNAILKNYLNHDIGLNDLFTLTQQITQYYRQHNFLVAQAILPPQQIENGTVTIQVIKGQLGNIDIQNNSRLRPEFVQRFSNTSLDPNLYVYKSELEKLALMLNDLQGIKTNLSLKAGKETGKTDLIIQLDNDKRFNGYAMLDNLGNKDTGQYRLSARGTIYNLLGYADNLSIGALTSNNAHLKSANVEYSGLIDGYGTRLGVRASYLTYKLGGDFQDLGAVGNSKVLSAYLLHPTVRSPNLRINTKLSFNHQKLTDKQTALSLVENRKINTLNLEIAGSWNAIKNGITYFNLATVFGREGNASNEASHNQAEDFKTKKSFTIFNYGLSHEQSLPKSFAINLGINGQFSDNNLDSSQKMLLGGLYGVRGYKSGAASVDEGHLAQIALKHYLPVFSNSILTSSIYYDYGWGKYYKRTEFLDKDVENKVKLQSAGLGLTLSAPNNYSINVTYSKPLGKKLVDNDSNQVWLYAIKTF